MKHYITVSLAMPPLWERTCTYLDRWHALIELCCFQFEHWRPCKIIHFEAKFMLVYTRKLTKLNFFFTQLKVRSKMHQKFNLSDFIASVSFFVHLFCLHVVFLLWAKIEIYDGRKQQSEERTAALFGRRVFNQRLQLAVFSPTESTRTWEQRTNDGRWSNKTICQHVENINQRGAMLYPPYAALPPHAALETPGNPPHLIHILHPHKTFSRPSSNALCVHSGSIVIFHAHANGE